MTAIICKRSGLDVLLLDGQERIGAKILMSGGTRCNVTNLTVTENDYESEAKRTVRHILKAFPSTRAVEFFEDLGIKMVLEEDGKFFPSTHSGKTILEGLVREVGRIGVRLETVQKVTAVKLDRNQFLICGRGFSYRAGTIVLCTGGLSYPSTGSDGVGYQIAEFFGHRLISTSPALTPLETDDADWKSLMGVSLPVGLTLWVDGKKEAFYEGPFLFTHFGFSGPAVLNISRHWIRQRKAHSVKLEANFLPFEKEDYLLNTLMHEIEKNPARLVKRFLSAKLPERFVETLLKKAGIPDSLILNQLKREARETLVRSLFHFPLSVTRALGYLKAEVTAGGVDLRELNSRTLESKIQPGLFFAGEILDSDGRIGGFNFQWAWSSAVVAGHGVVKRVHETAKKEEA